MNNTHVVIMAGGIGSRFWPLSTPSYPKQFIDILGCGKTMIQQTVERFTDICPASHVWVVTNASYVEIVKQQLPQIDVNHILAEPAARNTAPCIAWACWRIKEENPKANIVVTPSDAVVLNTIEFKRVISKALIFTQDRKAIVTIGIQPTRPETGYGYVEAGAVIDMEIRQVCNFKEKPDLKTAEQYVAAGNYFWNAGIFVWNAETISQCIKEYKPTIALQMNEIVERGDVSAIFPKCEKISIDYAVMEPASKEGLVYTHPADFGWSDLGNWTSLHEKLQKDEHLNGVVGHVTLIDCNDCTIHTEGLKRVVAQGLDGYIISEKDGQLLICKRKDEQQIKTWLE